MSSAIPHPIPDALAEILAARFRAMGDPMRLRLLDQLRDGERSVRELTDALGTSQQNVSKHLAVLQRAGIIGRRKDGTASLYAIADQNVLAICETVCGGLRAQLGELAALLDGAGAEV